MKLVHVIPGLSEEASGAAYVVPRLCQSLASCGNDVELMCSNARGDIAGVKLELYPKWAMFSRFSISPTLVRSLSNKAIVADIVHNHSLWAMVNIASGWVVPGRQAKLVISPHGTLSSWALNYSKWIKRAVWPLQRRGLARADLLHATSDGEYNEIRALGFNAPIVILPNGVDLPDLVEQKPLSNIRTLLFLSRIHPKKGIDRLLQAWQQLEQRHSSWQLVIVGRGDADHVLEATQMVTSLGLNRVIFPGPLYGADKSKAYTEAELFVLPTHSENFGMVVAEALAHGCPAVVSRGAPWPGLETEGCGWWINHNVEMLTETLDAAMRLPPEQLAVMGMKGRAWMQRDFSWDSVGRHMDAAYRWIVSGGDCPVCVKVD